MSRFDMPLPQLEQEIHKIEQDPNPTEAKKQLRMQMMVELERRKAAALNRK
jgi:hypothetical protein